MRYIKPFITGEGITRIPVHSILSYGYENGYTAIYTTLKKEPFLACASANEIAEEMYGEKNGR